MDKKLKLILAAMSKVTGLTRTEIEARLKFDDDTTDEAFETAVDEVLDVHAEKVKSQKGTDYSDGHKAGKKETLTDIEAKVKAKYKVSDSNKKGLDLIDEVVDSVKGTAADPAKLDEETIKKSPVYLALEKESQRLIKEATDSAETKVKEFETGLTRKEKVAEIVKEGMTAFDELKPILGETAEAKARRRAKFEKALTESIKVELTEDKQAILVDDKGKRLEDKHGNRIGIKDLVKPLAIEEGFEFHAADNRSSAGLGGNGQGNDPGKVADKKYQGQLPTKGDVKTYNSILADPKVSPEAKGEVMEYWGELNK